MTTFERLWRLATPMHPQAAPRPSLNGVTPRQRTIAALLVEGHTDSDIADRLGMIVRTARVHIAKLAATLGSESRAQLGYLIAESGIPQAEGCRSVTVSHAEHGPQEMNVRTARVHIAKLAAILGSESRAQLGYLIGQSGILGQGGRRGPGCCAGRRPGRPGLCGRPTASGWPRRGSPRGGRCARGPCGR
ncbi:hypothetical protein SVIOM342S_01067 [Streptomyces violaceorubidus]